MGALVVRKIGTRLISISNMTYQFTREISSLSNRVLWFSSAGHEEMRIFHVRKPEEPLPRLN